MTQWNHSCNVVGTCLEIKLSRKQLGFSPSHVWNPSPSPQHRTEPYALPQVIEIGVQGTQTCGAKFSPPPFAVVVQDDSHKSLIAVAAKPGWHRWNQCTFHVTPSFVRVRIDLEGHSSPEQARKHIGVAVIPAREAESGHQLLARGLKQLYPPAKPKTPKCPDWWRRPIYCGWGDQVGLSMHLEGPTEGWGEPRALAYCTQGLYTKWVERLEAADVPIGTVTIDNGWSDAGVWTPYPNQWPDLRGFIDGQHKKGRKVLLWIPTWYYEGLPDQWCVWMGNRKMTADPTHPGYRRFLKEQVHRLLSSAKGCYNADGFKIDQLAYVPSETKPCGGEQFGRSFQHKGRHPQITMHKNSTWGCELLWQLQHDIYDAAKNAKSDCLITSSTVHPYFRDTFDMVRLHDTDSTKTDVYDAMKARCELSRAALPEFPIDTDDWVHCAYEKWMDYTSRSYTLGVPCIFYAQWFVQNWHSMPAAREIPLEDLRKIGRIWQKL